jgi:hypothetical protein
MQFADFVGRDSRIVEINPRDCALGTRLVAAGCKNYLAVTTCPSRRDKLAASTPGLAKRIAVTSRTRYVRQNNAQVLILNGSSTLSVARYRAVRHANFVAIPWKVTPYFGLALQLGIMQCAWGFFALPRLVSVDAVGGRKLVVFRVRRPKPDRGARRFVPHGLGVEQFLRRVNFSGAKHAILRWFETLPDVAHGEDLDILIEDNALPRVKDLLDSGPGVQPIDLYSVTGLPGADYGKMTYYPPYMAEELLDRAVDHRGLCKVPAPREHFLSLAYHVVYHKGYASGLKRRDETAARYQCRDHDYTAILGELAARLGVDIPITLEDLDDYLATQGWRPPHDTLVRLTRNNAWAKTLITESGVHREDNGLAVFLIREQALHRGGVERAVQWLANRGFRILTVEHFDAAMVEHVSRRTRGGNWGQGPWCNSGGKPVAAIVVHDPNPIRPNRQRRRRQPHVYNARLFCKNDLRDLYNEGLPKEQHCNIVHSSDNESESMEYLRLFMPHRIDEVLALIEQSGTHRRAA